MMRKKIVWMLLLTMTTVGIAGCKTAEIEEEDGTDWRTYRAYIYLDWNTPEGQTELLAAAYESDGVIILAPNQEAYSPFPDCPLKDGIHDLDTVEDSLQMTDINQDGYDDLCVNDIIDGETVNEVFLYDPNSQAFLYSET